MQCRSLHCSIAVCLDQHFHSFFSVFSIENTEFYRCTDNVSKVTLSVQNSLGIIMCKFRTVQSKTEGMAASVRVFF